MSQALVASLEQQAAWRNALDRGVAAFAQLLAELDLLDPSDSEAVDALHHRLLADRLTVAFVAEFSRGKSELINAMFFADTGRRILPATPGRTTMCPVELYYRDGEAPMLSLLPIETRLHGLSLTELRRREDPWHRIPLDPTRPQALAKQFEAVTQTQRISVDMAERLGFWSRKFPQDNPQQHADGSVDVPAWRHALINYPHPLLRQGLAILDTPGLNAIGAEPELTLGLLPAAHATVFILAADAGVSRSDLAIWRDHLGGNMVERFVVLNKIDTLADPLLSATQVRAQIDKQRDLAAQTLGLPKSRVFALSARDALAARLADDAKALKRSRLPELEAALTGDLLPRQTELLARAAQAGVQSLRERAVRRLGDRRRQNAEQMLELRGLRGKSAAKVRLMLQRVDAEAADFERCTSRLSALHAVLARQLRDTLAPLSSDALRMELSAMQGAAAASIMGLGTRRVFATLCTRLRTTLAGAQERTAEMGKMLDASFRQLNTEFGFAFTLAPLPELGGFEEELALIENNYGRYLALSQVWRLAKPGFIDQFRRLLLSKLRVVFENAAGAIELWSKTASAQVDLQLRERRRAFHHRREALQRIQAAAGELEKRIAEVEAADQKLRDQLQRLDAGAAHAVALAQQVKAAPAHARVA